VQSELVDFLRYCRLERWLAEATCKAYERDVRACIAFLRERGIDDLAAVRPPDLRAFLAAEAETRPAVGSLDSCDVDHSVRGGRRMVSVERQGVS
jgi:site-specific recombinase XerD